MAGFRRGWVALAMTLALLGMGQRQASAQADVATAFKGKTVTIFVGFAAGGAAALEATLIANYLGKHIPGEPKVIVAYKPGAGSLTLANYIYNSAPANGLEIGRISTNLAFGDLLGDPAVQYHADKFNWIAASGSFEWILMLSKASPYGSVEAIKTAATPPNIGASGPLHYTSTIPRFMEDFLGMKFKIIQGYPGQADVRLAISRGEVDGSITSYSAFIENKQDEGFRSGQIGIPIQSGRGPDHASLPGLEKVPTIWSLAPQERQDLLRLVTPFWTNPYILPPNTPAPIVKALQDAFAGLTKDEAFLAEFEKVSGDKFAYTSGSDIAKDVASYQKATPETIKDLKNLSAEKSP